MLTETDAGKKEIWEDYGLLVFLFNAKLNNTSYSKLMGNLKKAGIDLNRKVLSEMAINAPEAFTELVKSVTK